MSQLIVSSEDLRKTVKKIGKKIYLLFMKEFMKEFMEEHSVARVGRRRIKYYCEIKEKFYYLFDTTCALSNFYWKM